eukprot:5162098-Prymnesium_polylepis.1
MRTRSTGTLRSRRYHDRESAESAVRVACGRVSIARLACRACEIRAALGATRCRAVHPYGLRLSLIHI